MMHKLADVSFHVSVAGNPRRLLRFKENKKGDIYIRLYSGSQIGLPPNEVVISEHRYSVHTSTKSPSYNTIKKHFTYVDKTNYTSVCVTNAIKSKGLFTVIFCCRMTSLTAPVYDISASDFSKSASLGQYDPERQCLVLALMVGNKESNFPDFIENGDVTKISVGMAKFVIVRTYLGIPAIEFAWTLDRITFPPEIACDHESHESFLLKMQGESWESCLNYINYGVNELKFNYLKTLHEVCDEPELRAEIYAEMQKLTRVAAIHL